VLRNMSIMKQPQLRLLISALQPLSSRLSSHYCSSIPTPFTASDSLFLSNLVHGKSHFEATTGSRQRRDTWPNSFQLLLQLHPTPILQLGPRLALGEPRRRRDLAIRHVLAVGFRSDAGAVHERARTNLGRAGQDLNSDTGGAVVDFAVEFAVAEARRREEGSAIDWAATNYVRIVLPQGGRGTYPGATQFTITPLELVGDRAAICLTTKIASSFETL